MIINKLLVGIKHTEYAPSWLQIEVTINDEHRMVKMCYQDDLKTQFDLIWENTGRIVQDYLRSKDAIVSNVSKNV